VTYKGDKPIIKNNIAMLITDMALIMASLIMARISQLLSILSFIISASMLGAGVYGYKMVTSDDFKQKMINEVISNINLPEVPKLPNKTGNVLPF
tara:strand:+ start:40 stop:324 length:285 start_codon:yes stop_codon:yes gene_type:complete